MCIILLGLYTIYGKSSYESKKILSILLTVVLCVGLCAYLYNEVPENFLAGYD